jgi:hypothetical protein
MSDRAESLLVSLQDAAVLTGLPSTSLRDQVRRGELPVVHPPAPVGAKRQRWYFRRADLLAAIERWTVTRRTRGPAPVARGKRLGERGEATSGTALGQRA